MKVNQVKINTINNFSQIKTGVNPAKMTVVVNKESKNTKDTVSFLGTHQGCYQKK